MRSHISASALVLDDVFACILGLPAALNDEISSFSIEFSARLFVFGCILGLAEALNHEI